MFDAFKGIIGAGGQDPTKIGAENFLLLLVQVIKLGLSVIGVIAFLYILVAGLQYILAGGNDAQQAQAKKAITAAIIGLLIVIFSLAAVNVLLRSLNIKDTIIDDPAFKEVIKE
jgi:cytosine/uracil/thiamine/allantoin permease